MSDQSGPEYSDDIRHVTVDTSDQNSKVVRVNKKIKGHRYHDFSYGHRVVGHENKCSYLHGHNCRVYFYVEGDKNQLDTIGRTLDFGVIKSLLCEWLEDNWDHKFLVYQEDPLLESLKQVDPDSIVVVPFNPTAEEMAQYLIEKIAPKQLEDTGCKLTSVTVMETRKCGATVDREEQEVG